MGSGVEGKAVVPGGQAGAGGVGVGAAAPAAPLLSSATSTGVVYVSSSNPHPDLT